MTKKHLIQHITAREILSSGGYPTIEATVTLTNDISASASVPFGISAGTHEAYMLLDKDPKRYDGNGMLKACAYIEKEIQAILIGKDVTDQKTIDRTMIELDGTENKSRLGGNTILVVSLACARAAAKALHEPLYKYIRRTFALPLPVWQLPKPMMVVLEGGAHADDSTDFQEYLLSVSGATTASEGVRWGEETYHALHALLKKKGMNANVGNEGAFAPPGIQDNEAPLKLLVEAIESAGYIPGKHIHLSLDVAASEFFDSKRNRYSLTRGKAVDVTSDELITLYNEWIKKYPILSLEDGLSEDDWEGWKKLFTSVHGRVRIVGDDLTVTNITRIKKAIEHNSIDAVLIKLNQIGTLTETIEAIQMGQSKHFWQIVSHRGGGETADAFMVDVAVAVNAEYIKVGPARGERTEKYNRLLAIEEELSHEK